MDDVLLPSVCILFCPSLGASIKFIQIPPKSAAVTDLPCTVNSIQLQDVFSKGKLSSQRQNSPDIQRSLLPLRWRHCQQVPAPLRLSGFKVTACCLSDFLGV